MTMMMVSLRAEAEAEAARLAGARSRCRNGDGETLLTLEADGPWVLVARRAGLRRRLGRRALLIWRIACEDGTSRTVESRLAAITIQLSGFARPRTRAWIDILLHALDADARALVDADVRDWREAAEAAARSFASARRLREQAIAAGSREADRSAFQPGLFDRRAERRREQASAVSAEAHRSAVDRLAALERSAATIIGPARLLLAVFP